MPGFSGPDARQQVPQPALRRRVLDLLACLHAGDVDEATGVVLESCTDLAPGPTLVAFTTALADQLAESYQVLRLGYDGTDPVGLDADDGSPMATVLQVLSSVADEDTTGQEAAVQQLAGGTFDVLLAVPAVLALASATLVAVAGEAGLYDESVPQTIRRVRARWR